MSRRFLLILVSILEPSWASGRALLLISIDGLRPDYVLQADAHNLKIPLLLFRPSAVNSR